MYRLLNHHRQFVQWYPACVAVGSAYINRQIDSHQCCH